MTLKFNYEKTEAGPGLKALSSIGDAGEYCKACEDPDIIPIYPSRIAWNDLFGEVNGNLEYPKELPAAASRGPKYSGGFTLRKLRKGIFYMFDETNKVWSVFYFQPDDSATGGRFSRSEWRPDQSEWVTTEHNLLLPYVREDAETIHIAFSQHAWSSRILTNMQNNTNGLRDKAMIKITPTAPSPKTFSAPIEELGNLVEEFSDCSISQLPEDWNTLGDKNFTKSKSAAILTSSSVKKSRGKPIFVAVHDPLGVANEITASHMNRTSLRAAYLQDNIYPLTTARAVDTLLQTASRGLASGKTSSQARRMFREWPEAVNSEYKKFLDNTEEQLKDYEKVVEGVLDAWEAFFTFGMNAPGSEPGSLATHLLLFNADDPIQEEIRGLLNAAKEAVAALSSSQAGQARMRSIVFSQDNWDPEKNIVAAVISIIGASLGGANNLIKIKDDAKAKAATLMEDISMPLAQEIVKMKRIDLMQEVNRFANGIIGRSITRVEVPIEDAVAEITTGRRRPKQRTKLVEKGHMLHTIQRNVGVYKYDGVIHVSGVPGTRMISKVTEGFGLFTNALNIFDLIEQSKNDKLTGRYAVDPRKALILTCLETVTSITSAVGSFSAPGTTTRSYFVHGRLTRVQVKKLIAGKSASEDFLRTLVKEGDVVSTGLVPPVPESRVLKIAGRVGTMIGISLALLDFFNAYDAYRRGDSNAVVSGVSLGLGALLMTVGAALSWGPGVAIGIVLLVVGAIAALFVDDPVERWLKNCFWGIARNYLFWNDQSRTKIRKYGSKLNPEAKGPFEKQAEAARSKGHSADYDIPKFFAREMQEFHEFVYWPQDANDPAQVSPTFPNGHEWKFNINRGFWREAVSTTLGVREADSGQSSFRLPNFIDGISEFDAKIHVAVYWARTRMIPSTRVQNSGFTEFDVTQQFMDTLTVQGDVLTGSWQITKDDLARKIGRFEVKWHATMVGILKGWIYTPTSEIALPQQYSRHWDFSGYDKDKLGGRDIIRI